MGHQQVACWLAAGAVLVSGNLTHLAGSGSLWRQATIPTLPRSSFPFRGLRMSYGQTTYLWSETLHGGRMPQRRMPVERAYNGGKGYHSVWKSHYNSAVGLACASGHKGSLTTPPSSRSSSLSMSSGY